MLEVASYITLAALDGIFCIIFTVLPIVFLLAAIKNWGKQPPCYHCGNRNRVSARFCAQCGARLT
jgi:hypothetical protein